MGAALALGVSRVAAQEPASETDANSGDEPVTYADVLANPDDVDINYRYARRLIEAGNLNRAGAALERILITNPEADRIRLLYGVVLYRLGNDGEALRELNAVDRDDLDPEDQRTLDETRSRIRRLRQRFQGSVGLSAGLHLDTNLNAFPEGGQFQIGGTNTLALPGSENTDVGEFVLLDGRARIRTPWQRVPSVTVEAAGLRDNQVQEDSLDTWSGLFGVSTTYRGDTYNVSPSLTYRHTLLAGERYLSDATARLRVSRQFGYDVGLTGFVEGGLGYEDYGNVDRSPLADERDGPVYSAVIGTRATPTDRLDLGLRYRFQRKGADQDFERFTEHRITADAIYVLTNGVSLSGTVFYARRTFDAVDTFVARNDVERDDEYFGRLRIGAGIDALLEMAGLAGGGSVTDNLQISLAGQYRSVESNIPNFTYDNIRVETAISKRFPF